MVAGHRARLPRSGGGGSRAEVARRRVDVGHGRDRLSCAPRPRTRPGPAAPTASCRSGTSGSARTPTSTTRPRSSRRAPSPTSSPTPSTRAAPHTRFNTAGITMADFANSFSRFDNYVDTSDFDLTYLMNLWYGYRDLLPADVRAATEAHFKSFKYWYTDPQPAGVVDQRYYWSENHRLLYHADEYLAGQAFPNDVFSSDGHTGAWHRDRANGFIDKWLTEKAKYGFTEWHSDVYYQKTFDALHHVRRVGERPGAQPARVDGARPAALRHRAPHPEGQRRRDPRPLVHEGQERRDRPGHLQPVEAALRRHQPRLQLHRRPRRHPHGPGPPVPDARGDPAGRAVEAHDRRPGAHGRAARPGRAGRPDPDRLDGHSFNDPAEVQFWWEKGAQTAWQTVPLTVDTLDAYRAVGLGLLQAVQAARRPHRRRPRRAAQTSRSRSRRCSASGC